MEGMNKFVIVVVIVALIYFLLLNPSQKEVVNTQSTHALSTAKTFVQGGVAAVKNDSAKESNSVGGNTTLSGG